MTTTDPTTTTVLDRAPLPSSGPWPTVDPFLFCVHHLDAYPTGNGRLGPEADLSGREIGSDFSVRDGWSMYHGTSVPGFPQHPHRGFETVTVVRQGLVDHSDSLGATARYGAGDTQWLTAGGGIVHAEMFPLVDAGGPNPLELFQIWLNLPAASKMADPHFSMFWSEDTPVVTHEDAAGRRRRVTVVAGALDGVGPPAPPPDSWAADPRSDVAIWVAVMDPGADWTLPAAPDGVVRTIYVLHRSGPVTVGEATTAGDDALDPGTVAILDPSEQVVITAAGDEPADLLVLQGRPLAEPVARYGPFVMNTEDEIRQAFADYRATGFGGWPWGSDDPTHGSDSGRFAVHADGRLDEPPAS